MLKKLKVLIKRKSNTHTKYISKQLFTAKFDDLDMQFAISMN